MRIRPAPASAERDELPTSNRAQSCVQKILAGDISPIAPEISGGEHLLPTFPIALLQVRIGSPERVWRRKVVSEEHQPRSYTPSWFDQKRRNARLHLGKPLGKPRLGFVFRRAARECQHSPRNGTRRPYGHHPEYPAPQVARGA